MEKLAEGIEGWNEYHQGDLEVGWFVCNSLAYSLAGEEIKFLSGQVKDAGEIEIAVFTATYLVYFKGVPGATGPSYRIIPRTRLSHLEVRSAPAVIPARSMRQDHGTESFAVEYGDSPKFTLPCAPDTYNRKIHDFAPTLWADLLR